MAVAIAGLLVTATACSRSSSEKLDTAALLLELSERGMAFQHIEQRGENFDQMNGFSSGAKYEWQGNDLYVMEFVGLGEALIAASRVSQDGTTFSYPGRGATLWHTATIYCCPDPLNHFHRHSNIVSYMGADNAVHEALEEIMGAPFAGYDAPEWDFDSGDERPHFEGLWKKFPLPVRNVTDRKYAFSERTKLREIVFEAYTAKSFSCVGTDGRSEWTLNGNQIFITHTQAIVNLGVARMAEPCDLEWRWQSQSVAPTGLRWGQKYWVYINGERVTSFTAR